MSDRLPPLTALRAFEAAARHMSFALAAAELNVTPAALSFQIKSLEAHLGEPLIRDWMTPMMTLDLAEQYGTLEKLAHVPLIHDESIASFKQPTDWAAWCRTVGASFDTAHGLRFSQADHALDAAISGAGVVLGRVSLATRAFEQGRLVAPFETGLLTEAQFRFICPHGTEKRLHVAAFRNWMFEEIKASPLFEKNRTLVPPK